MMKVSGLQIPFREFGGFFFAGKKKPGEDVMRRNKLVLVLGGARSGKSSFALNLAGKLFRKPVYLATAQAIDAEMTERIRLHRSARSQKWNCVEEPLDAAKVILHPPECDGILMDCVTVWLSNVVVREGEKAFAGRRQEIVSALKKRKRSIIVVSNEVGMGIVPNTELGRKFRDLAGWLNQDLAAIADAVVLVTAGLPMVLKGKIPTAKGRE
jgi:adenosylcobinamide kinase/adenosylcobinamide-phosphate guanylyltransferase